LNKFGKQLKVLNKLEDFYLDKSAKSFLAKNMKLCENITVFANNLKILSNPKVLFAKLRKVFVNYRDDNSREFTIFCDNYKTIVKSIHMNANCIENEHEFEILANGQYIKLNSLPH